MRHGFLFAMAIGLTFNCYAEVDFKEIKTQIENQIVRLSNDTYQSKSDRQTADELLRLYRDWLKSYENSESDPMATYKEYRKQVAEIFRRKQIVAYEYNEFLKMETEVPILFNLFKDANRYYFKVGDGDLSTIAEIPPSEMIGLMRAIDKVKDWGDTCKKEQMDTRKDIGSFGGFSMEFVSQQKGENISVWLTAKGEWGQDRMIEEQTVRLNLLNMRAMFYQMGQAGELLEARTQQRENASKLK